MTYEAFDRGERVYSLRADEIIHRKVKAGPLTLNPVKEVEMTGVRIEARLEDGPGTEGIDLPIRSMLEGALAAKDLGFVSRVVIDRIEVAFLREGRPALSIAAGRASTGVDPEVLRFEAGFSLTAGDGRRLTAGSAEWRYKSRRLVIGGRYTLESGRDSTRGQGASFSVGSDGSLRME